MSKKTQQAEQSTNQPTAGAQQKSDKPKQAPKAQQKSDKPKQAPKAQQKSDKPKQAPKAKKNKPSPEQNNGGHPSANQKKRVMAGEQSRVRKPSQKQRNMGLNFWESMPYMETTVLLKTNHAQQTFARVARNLAVNCFLVDVYPSIHAWSYWSDIIGCMDKLVTAAYTRAEAAFTECEQQIQHMKTMLGIDEGETVNYINATTYRYAVTTPRVKQYLRLLERFDHIVMNLDALWMTEGGITSTYQRAESMRLRGRLQKYVGTLFHQSDRIRRVIAGRATTAAILQELHDELEKHYGAGLTETDEQGNDMLLPGERELTGAVVGEDVEDANA